MEVGEYKEKVKILEELRMKLNKCALTIITDYRNGELDWSESRCKGFENRVYRIPRKEFYNLNLNLDVAGCYIMITESKKSGVEFKIYIGSSDNIRQRVSTNHKHEKWWDELMVFINIGSDLQGSEALYLEKKLYEWFDDRRKKYEFMNMATPKKSSISDINKMSLDNSFEIFKFITRSTGFRFFIPNIEKYIPKQKVIIEESNVIPKTVTDTPLVKSNNISIKLEDIEFICTRSSPRTAEGRGKRLSTGEFELFKGSVIVTTPNPSYYKSGGIKHREKLINEGIIIENEKKRLVLTRNYILSSPTRAANLVIGSSAGYEKWKDIRGKSLKKYMDEIKLNK